jgi:hypothetical protein
MAQKPGLKPNTSLECFYTEFHEHLQREDEQMRRLIECQEQNAKAISELAEVCKSMGEVLIVYQSIVGVIRTGTAVQKFGLWLIKWPLIGVGLYTIYQTSIDKITQLMSNNP